MSAEPGQPTASDAEVPPSGFDDAAPSGQHAVEIAARAGFGPLSPLGKIVWHGEAVPCVSCGQLVRRGEESCEHCGQDLSHEMIEKMRAHAGPWFVLEHVRPFPGVSLERIVRQIRRGLIGETSIVRGPSTDYQWRFAVETPGLCRYFGRCWSCHQQVSQADNYCRHCLAYISFERPRASPGTDAASRLAARASSTSLERLAGMGAGGAIGSAPMIQADGGSARAGIADSSGGAPGSSWRGRMISTRDRPPVSSERRDDEATDLALLSAAARRARQTQATVEWEEPPRVAGIRATWIAAGLMIAAVIALLAISRARSERPVPASSSGSLPAAVSPIESPSMIQPGTRSSPSSAPETPDDTQRPPRP